MLLIKNKYAYLLYFTVIRRRDRRGRRRLPGATYNPSGARAHTRVAAVFHVYNGDNPAASGAAPDGRHPRAPGR